jgi:hypothetical protein
MAIAAVARGNVNLKAIITDIFDLDKKMDAMESSVTDNRTS